MEFCKQKIGFLSLKDCGKPASGTCEGCLKPICGEHSYFLNDENGQLTLCQECYLQKIDEKEALDNNLEEEYKKRDLYDSFGYYGYSSRYYDYNDLYESDDGIEMADADEEGYLDSDAFQDS